ncbi:MAG TPA: ATP-dependent DNA ligase, partial [Nitrososphaeraceae archaeon]|nr:ATP-dependent DNA ligase [Nitrososphaeraceae archaeon]
MLLSKLVDTFEKMEETRSRLLLTDHLVTLLRETKSNIIDKVIYLIQGKLGPPYEGIELGMAEKMAVRALAQSSGKHVTDILTIYHEKGDLGDTAAEAMKTRNQITLFSQEMTVERVFTTLFKIAKTTGPGSQETKLRLVSSLLNETTPREARYIMKFLMGTLRLGIADFTVLDSLSIAFTNDKSNRSLLENAYNVSGDLGLVAKELSSNGIESVRSIHITLFKPIRPMLAERVSSIEEGLDRMEGFAGIEYKIDGERVQIHKGKKKKGVRGYDNAGRDPERVELFSRRLENITNHYPDVVRAIRKMDNLKEVILEGEIVAIDPSTAEFLPFQELMHRRRKYGVEEAMKSYPVIVNLFDVLFNNSKSVTNIAYKKRRQILTKLVRTQDADDDDDDNGKVSSGKTATRKRSRGGKSVTDLERTSNSQAVAGKVAKRSAEESGGIHVEHESQLMSNVETRPVSKENKENSIQNTPKEDSAKRIRLIKQIVSGDKKEIQKFMDSAIEAGCEGVMLKHVESVYRAGSREYLWIKVKREYRSELADTLDLVIVGALYGRGRRVGKYGALLLAAYDEEEDLFRSVSKVGTGFTDQHLESFYNSLESFRIEHRSPRVDTRMDQMDVWFEPKIVIEVVASEITLSPAHTAGLNSIREGAGLAL